MGERERERDRDRPPRRGKLRALEVKGAAKPGTVWVVDEEFPLGVRDQLLQLQRLTKLSVCTFHADPHAPPLDVRCSPARLGLETEVWVFDANSDDETLTATDSLAATHRTNLGTDDAGMFAANDADERVPPSYAAVDADAVSAATTAAPVRRSVRRVARIRNANGMALNHSGGASLGDESMVDYNTMAAATAGGFPAHYYNPAAPGGFGYGHGYGAPGEQPQHAHPHAYYAPPPGVPLTPDAMAAAWEPPVSVEGGLPPQPRRAAGSPQAPPPADSQQPPAHGLMSRTSAAASTPSYRGVLVPRDGEGGGEGGPGAGAGVRVGLPPNAGTRPPVSTGFLPDRGPLVAPARDEGCTPWDAHEAHKAAGARTSDGDSESETEDTEEDGDDADDLNTSGIHQLKMSHCSSVGARAARGVGSRTRESLGRSVRSTQSTLRLPRHASHTSAAVHSRSSLMARTHSSMPAEANHTHASAMDSFPAAAETCGVCARGGVRRRARLRCSTCAMDFCVHGCWDLWHRHPSRQTTGLHAIHLIASDAPHAAPLEKLKYYVPTYFHGAPGVPAQTPGGEVSANGEGERKKRLFGRGGGSGRDAIRPSRYHEETCTLCRREPAVAVGVHGSRRSRAVGFLKSLVQRGAGPPWVCLVCLLTKSDAEIARLGTLSLRLAPCELCGDQEARPALLHCADCRLHLCPHCWAFEHTALLPARHRATALYPSPTLYLLSLVPLFAPYIRFLEAAPDGILQPAFTDRAAQPLAARLALARASKKPPPQLVPNAWTRSYPHFPEDIVIDDTAPPADDAAPADPRGAGAPRASREVPPGPPVSRRLSTDTFDDVLPGDVRCERQEGAGGPPIAVASNVAATEDAGPKFVADEGIVRGGGAGVGVAPNARRTMPRGRGGGGGGAPPAATSPRMPSRSPVRNPTASVAAIVQELTAAQGQVVASKPASMLSRQQQQQQYARSALRDGRARGVALHRDPAGVGERSVMWGDTVHVPPPSGPSTEPKSAGIGISGGGRGSGSTSSPWTPPRGSASTSTSFPLPPYNVPYNTPSASRSRVALQATTPATGPTPQPARGRGRGGYGGFDRMFDGTTSSLEITGVMKTNSMTL